MVRDTDEDYVMIMSETVKVNRVRKKLLVDLTRDETRITCQLDTAASRNIVQARLYKVV